MHGDKLETGVFIQPGCRGRVDSRLTIMEHAETVDKTIAFVKQTLKDAEGGHDWWHIHRVWNNTRLIAQTEQADALTVELAALLHDIADSKFHNGDEEIGPQTAGNFLSSISVDAETIRHVQ